MLIFLKIPHENGIILSQKGVQVNHMNPPASAIVDARTCIINKEISLYRYVDIISFLFYGAVIWYPYGTHLGNPHMG